MENQDAHFAHSPLTHAETICCLAGKFGRVYGRRWITVVIAEPLSGENALHLVLFKLRMCSVTLYTELWVKVF